MTCERLIGRVGVDDHVDWVDIDWPQTVRRALRLISRAGRRINVLLPRQHPSLRHGDLLATGDGVAVAIYVRPVRLLRVRPADITTMGLICAELGNQHVPMEINADVVITLDDGPAAEIAHRHKAHCEPFTGPFHPLRATITADAIVDRRPSNLTRPPLQ